MNPPFALILGVIGNPVADSLRHVFAFRASEVLHTVRAVGHELHAARKSDAHPFAKKQCSQRNLLTQKRESFIFSNPLDESRGK